jgi:DNA invertase Pin-like site-specific DNA recombinase
MDAVTAVDTPALTKQQLPEIIQRYLDGESIQTIAKDARVARRTIYKWMHRIGDHEYYDLVTDAMITRLADADHELSVARTKGHIARAREEARYTRWDLERRRPSIFGYKQEVKQDTTVTITVQKYVQEPPKQVNQTPQPVVFLPDQRNDER